MMTWKPGGSGASGQEGRMRLFSWLWPDPITETEIRSEIWRLGTRHFGEPLQGALGELEASDLPQRRAVLLRACVRRLQRR